MSDQALKMIQRLRASGALLILGLLVEAFSLFWNHPLSFIAFATVGMLLILAGVALYLFSVLGYMPAEEQVVVDRSKV